VGAGGRTGCAGVAERLDIRPLEEAGAPPARVLAQERHGAPGVVEIHASLAQPGEDRAGQGVGVDLESQAERRARAQAVPRPAEAAAGDHLVQAENTAPESLVAEGVVTKRLPALLQEWLGRMPRFVLGFRPVEIGEAGALGASRDLESEGEESHTDHEGEEDGGPGWRTHGDTSRTSAGRRGHR